MMRILITIDIYSYAFKMGFFKNVEGQFEDARSILQQDAITSCPSKQLIDR